MKEPNDVVNAFKVDPVYLRHEQQNVVPDFRVRNQKENSYTKTLKKSTALANSTGPQIPVPEALVRPPPSGCRILTAAHPHTSGSCPWVRGIRTERPAFRNFRGSHHGADLLPPEGTVYLEVNFLWKSFFFQGGNETNEKLLSRINGEGKIHLVPSKIKDTYFLRFAVCSRFTESADVTLAWKVVQDLATEILGK